MKKQQFTMMVPLKDLKAEYLCSDCAPKLGSYYVQQNSPVGKSLREYMALCTRLLAAREQNVEVVKAYNPSSTPLPAVSRTQSLLDYKKTLLDMKQVANRNDWADLAEVLARDVEVIDGLIDENRELWSGELGQLSLARTVAFNNLKNNAPPRPGGHKGAPRTPEHADVLKRPWQMESLMLNGFLVWGASLSAGYSVAESRELARKAVLEQAGNTAFTGAKDIPLVVSPQPGMTLDSFSQYATSEWVAHVMGDLCGHWEKLLTEALTPEATTPVFVKVERHVNEAVVELGMRRASQGDVELLLLPRIAAGTREKLTQVAALDAPEHLLEQTLSLSAHGMRLNDAFDAAVSINTPLVSQEHQGEGLHVSDEAAPTARSVKIHARAKDPAPGRAVR
jgi:hypothetical protein